MCQIDHCDQIPTGRCATCERVFCNRHRGYTRGYEYAPGFFKQVPCVDKCADCHGVEERAEQAKHNEEHAKYEAQRAKEHAAQEYLISGAARAALLTSGVQPVKLYEVWQRWKTGLFGLGGRDVDEVIATGHGWVLGEFKWEYLEHLPYGEGEFRSENCFTALLESSGSLPHSSMLPLSPVRPYSEGYALCSSDVRGGKYSVFRDNLTAAAEAVKRLAGVSS